MRTALSCRRSDRFFPAKPESISPASCVIDDIAMALPETHKAVRLHPAEHVIQVETLPTPKYVQVALFFPATD